MGRHTGASCKLCRREGEKLFLKGEKCYTAKCSFVKRSYPPGQHGKKPARFSEYRIRLREKQKARRIYGLTEKQFAGYFEKADRKKGSTGERLLEYLERRLDNVVYRLGFALSRQEARQMVGHGQIDVNGKKVTIPSFQVKVGDDVAARGKATARVKANIEKFPDKNPPAWLVLSDEAKGKVEALPQRGDIEATLEENLIVEYYSR